MVVTEWKRGAGNIRRRDRDTRRVRERGSRRGRRTTWRRLAFFFFPPFPKAMRGIPPGRCKLHGPGSTWKASQRLHKKLKQANKKTRLKKQPEIPVRQARLSSEIKISRAKIRQRVVKRHIHSKYAPKTCIPSISKRPNQMTEGENQTN